MSSNRPSNASRYNYGTGGNAIKRGQFKCLQFGRISNRFCRFEILCGLRYSTQTNATKHLVFLSLILSSFLLYILSTISIFINVCVTHFINEDVLMKVRDRIA
jgi:hypothetical protein